MSTSHIFLILIKMFKLTPCVPSKYLSKEIQIFVTVKHASGTQQIALYPDQSPILTSNSYDRKPVTQNRHIQEPREAKQQLALQRVLTSGEGKIGTDGTTKSRDGWMDGWMDASHCRLSRL